MTAPAMNEEFMPDQSNEAPVPIQLEYRSPADILHGPSVWRVFAGLLSGFVFLVTAILGCICVGLVIGVLLNYKYSPGSSRDSTAVDLCIYLTAGLILLCSSCILGWFTYSQLTWR